MSIGIGDATGAAVIRGRQISQDGPSEVSEWDRLRTNRR